MTIPNLSANCTSQFYEKKPELISDISKCENKVELIKSLEDKIDPLTLLHAYANSKIKQSPSVNKANLEFLNLINFYRSYEKDDNRLLRDKRLISLLKFASSNSSITERAQFSWNQGKNIATIEKEIIQKASQLPDNLFSESEKEIFIQNLASHNYFFQNQKFLSKFGKDFDDSSKLFFTLRNLGEGLMHLREHTNLYAEIVKTDIAGLSERNQNYEKLRSDSTKLFLELQALKNPAYTRFATKKARKLNNELKDVKSLDVYGSFDAKRDRIMLKKTDEVHELTAISTVALNNTFRMGIIEAISNSAYRSRVNWSKKDETEVTINTSQLAEFIENPTVSKIQYENAVYLKGINALEKFAVEHNLSTLGNDKKLNDIEEINGTIQAYISQTNKNKNQRMSWLKSLYFGITQIPKNYLKKLLNLRKIPSELFKGIKGEKALGHATIDALEHYLEFELARGYLTRPKDLGIYTIGLRALESKHNPAQFLATNPFISTGIDIVYPINPSTKIDIQGSVTKAKKAFKDMKENGFKDSQSLYAAYDIYTLGSLISNPATFNSFGATKKTPKIAFERKLKADYDFFANN